MTDMCIKPWLKIGLPIVLSVCFMALMVPSSQAGYIYALRTDSFDNHIYGFEFDERQGSLKPLTGFPVTTGAKGKLAFSGGKLVYDQPRARLFILNNRSNTVNAYTVNVVNGNLVPTVFSPIVLPAGNWSCLAVHPSGSPLIIASEDSNKILSYLITSDKAIPASGSPFSLGVNTLSCAFAQDGGYLYLGGSANGLMAVVQVNKDSGTLSPLPGSPYQTFMSPDAPEVTRGFTADDQGRLFVVESDSGKIKGFNLMAGVPTEISDLSTISNLSSAADALWHPKGFLYISDWKNNRIGAYRIAGTGVSTTVTVIQSFPVDTGGMAPRWLTRNVASNLLFVANTDSRNIATLKVDQGAGRIELAETQDQNTLGQSGIVQGLVYAQSVPSPTLRLSSEGETLTLTIGLDAGGWLGKVTDWWLVHIQDDQFESFSIDTLKFVSGLQPLAQGPLVSIDDFDFSIPAPPAGQHTYCLAVDSTANGIIDGDSLFLQCDEIEISP